MVVLAAAFASTEDRASFRSVHGSKASTENIRSSTRRTAAALWWLLALFTIAVRVRRWNESLADVDATTGREEASVAGFEGGSGESDQDSG